jgi:hypothetical protein
MSRPTYKEACAVIEQSKIFTKPDGTHPTAKEIWEYSPTGELSAIPEWYEMAKKVLEESKP